MRWFLGTVLTILVVMGLYFGSLIKSLAGLMDAVQTGNGGEVVARTDMNELRHSLTDQIVRTYLKRMGNLNPVQRMIADTYGASVADAMLQKFLTAENITNLLRNGTVTGASEDANWTMVPLSKIDVTKLTDLLGRWRPIQPLRVEVRTSDTTSPQEYSAIGLHFEGGSWKLSGLLLPQDALQKLARSLPAR